LHNLFFEKNETGQDREFKILESVLPDGLIHSYTACLVDDPANPVLLATGRFEYSPFISFRWLKSPGEIYGRSPVMKALPDIKTVNKVVELILKNASIAVTGIWQADDDGVLNPANIELVPGSIIPKAVGSQGLQPLQMPGRFDISQLMLDNLQARVRHALLTDRLTPVTGPRMTATEILERSNEMSMLLGATYGRLQSELLTPLIKRAYSILRRRGEVPDIALDGRIVTIDYRSPLARAQGQRNVQNTLSWITSVLAPWAPQPPRASISPPPRVFSAKRWPCRPISSKNNRSLKETRMFKRRLPVERLSEKAFIYSLPDPSKFELREIEHAFTRLFSSDDGRKVLAHLQAITFQRALGAATSDEQIRYAEGQRSLVATILRLIDRGRN
jgi:hypothetical protein